MVDACFNLRILSCSPSTSHLLVLALELSVVAHAGLFPLTITCEVLLAPLLSHLLECFLTLLDHLVCVSLLLLKEIVIPLLALQLEVQPGLLHVLAQLCFLCITLLDCLCHDALRFHLASLVLGTHIPLVVEAGLSLLFLELPEFSLHLLTLSSNLVLVLKHLVLVQATLILLKLSCQYIHLGHGLGTCSLMPLTLRVEVVLECLHQIVMIPM